VDLPNFSGYTAAHVATVANKQRALAALLAGGANIAARCWSEGADWISGCVVRRLGGGWTVGCLCGARTLRRAPLDRECEATGWGLGVEASASC
jgi:hypothetical protein